MRELPWICDLLEQGGDEADDIVDGNYGGESHFLSVLRDHGETPAVVEIDFDWRGFAYEATEMLVRRLQPAFPKSIVLRPLTNATIQLIVPFCSGVAELETLRHRLLAAFAEKPLLAPLEDGDLFARAHELDAAPDGRAAIPEIEIDCLLVDDAKDYAETVWLAGPAARRGHWSNEPVVRTCHFGTWAPTLSRAGLLDWVLPRAREEGLPLTLGLIGPTDGWDRYRDDDTIHHCVSFDVRWACVHAFLEESDCELAELDHGAQLPLAALIQQPLGEAVRMLDDLAADLAARSYNDHDAWYPEEIVPAGALTFATTAADVSAGTHIDNALAALDQATRQWMAPPHDGQR